MNISDQLPFTGSKPDLVSGKIINDIEAKLNITKHDSKNIFNGLGNFYQDFIRPNMFPLLVIGLLCIYLTIKYIIKKDRDEEISKTSIHSQKSSVIEQQVVEKNIAEQKIAEPKDVPIIKERIVYKERDVVNNNSNNPYDDIASHISDDYLLTDE